MFRTISHLNCLPYTTSLSIENTKQTVYAQGMAKFSAEDSNDFRLCGPYKSLSHILIF